MSGFQHGATYEEIRQRVKEQTGLHVTNLNIAQVKQKYGIREQENHNLPRSENYRQPKCPREKEAAIEKAMRFYHMF